MRTIKEIIIHCTATQQNATPKAIKNYHVNDCKYSDIGYHFIISEDGMIWRGRSIYSTGAHCIGHNQESIGIAYIGGLRQNGLPSNTITKEQRISLFRLVNALTVIFNLKEKDIRMHNEFANKECPCFTKGEFHSMMENTWMFEGVKILDCLNI